MTIQYGKIANTDFVGFRTCTEVEYPDGGPKYNRWDYFWAPLESLPAHYRPENLSVEDSDSLYDFLNKGDYWVKGWSEIDQSDEEWIESHPDAHGLQSEVVIEISII